MQSQGYFEFRLCPHNTRRRPAQQVNENIFQRECFEGKILIFSRKLRRRKYLFLKLFLAGLLRPASAEERGGRCSFPSTASGTSWKQVGFWFDRSSHFFLHSFPFGWWWWTSNVMPRYWMRYRLPEGVSCALCVLQWRYWAGNSWGRFSTQFIKISSLLIFIILVPTRCNNGSWCDNFFIITILTIRCENGTESIGCGPQEEFRACADLAIHSLEGKVMFIQRHSRHFSSSYNAIRVIFLQRCWVLSLYFFQSILEVVRFT